MLTPEHEEIGMTLAGDLIFMDDQDVNLLATLSLFRQLKSVLERQ
jgi:hypothetical protein